MDCLPVSKLPEGPQWAWEIKLDGYRAVAVKSGGAVTLYSRSRKILNKRFPYIIEPLRGLPDGTVVEAQGTRKFEEARLSKPDTLTTEHLADKLLHCSTTGNIDRR
jgi:ATP-dependent DNA ligase